MTTQQFIKAVIYHTDEERLGNYFRTVIETIVSILAFIYTAGVMIGEFYNKLVTVSLTIAQQVKSTYTTVTTTIQENLNQYHGFTDSNNQRIEALTVTNAQGG